MAERLKTQPEPEFTIPELPEDEQPRTYRDGDIEITLPSRAEARRLSEKYEKLYRERLAELREKLPPWDKDVDTFRFTI